MNGWMKGGLDGEGWMDACILTLRDRWPEPHTAMSPQARVGKVTSVPRHGRALSGHPRGLNYDHRASQEQGTIRSARARSPLCLSGSLSRSLFYSACLSMLSLSMYLYRPPPSLPTSLALSIVLFPSFLFTPSILSLSIPL